MTVDPASETGQSLYLQYLGKKGKVVLGLSSEPRCLLFNSPPLMYSLLGWKWAEECVKRGQLLTYAADWGGFKVNGTER